MKTFAYLDSNNIVTGFLNVLIGDDVTAPNNTAEVTEMDNSLVGKKYDPDTNSFYFPLEQVKENKKAELLQAYYSSFTNFHSNAIGTLKTYPIDAEAQDNLRDLQTRLIADPNKDSFWFKTVEDGTLIQHTRAQFLQLLEDAESYKVQQTQHYDSLIGQVDNASDESTVDAITW